MTIGFVLLILENPLYSEELKSEKSRPVLSKAKAIMKEGSEREMQSHTV